MAAPTMLLDVAFASDPFDASQTYSDVTAFGRGTDVAYGRRSEEETPAAGASTTVLLNNDRRFDPLHVAGPYYPNVLPERRVRCRATLEGVTYPVFVHFADGWPQAYEHSKTEVPVVATDGMEILAQAELPTGTAFALEPSGTRIGNILDAVGWPAAERTIDAGKSNVLAAPEGSLDGILALDLIQDAANTELGLAYVAPDGKFIFHDRHHRLIAPYTTSQATFTDVQGATLGYSGLVTNFTRAQVKNDWRITPSGGTEQTAEDATSIGKYRRRTRRRATLHTTDAEAKRQADFLTSRYKDPALRIDELEIRPGNSTALWTQVLTRTLGDRITVVRTPVGGGVPISQEVIIEGIRHDFPVDIVASATRWRLSPADTNTYWILGVSALGVNTRLAY